MAEAETTIRVLAKDAPEPETAALFDKSVRERWNDYGIGLLLQGDLKGAEAAFLEGDADGAGLRGRVGERRPRAPHEGNLAGAEEVLRQALAVDPGLAKTHFFLGTVLKQAGRYDEALAIPAPRRRALPARPRGAQPARAAPVPEAPVPRGGRGARAGPRDRSRGPAGALQPDALLPGGRRREMAKKHEAFYRRFKADESAQTITGPYRQLHPHDNNERQAVHEHASGRSPPRRRRTRRRARPRPGRREAGAAARPASAHAASPARAAAGGPAVRARRLVAAALVVALPAALLPGRALPQSGGGSSSPT